MLRHTALTVMGLVRSWMKIRARCNWLQGWCNFILLPLEGPVEAWAGWLKIRCSRLRGKVRVAGVLGILAGRFGSDRWRGVKQLMGRGSGAVLTMLLLRGRERWSRWPRFNRTVWVWQELIPSSSGVSRVMRFAWGGKVGKKRLSSWLWRPA